MPDGRPLMPRIRMPRVTVPGRASRAASEAPTEPKEAAKAGNGASPAATKEATPADAKPTEAKPAAGAKAPEPNLQERFEGLQGWLAEIERKQARITYFGGLLLLVALAAAGAALYFGLTTQSDSATKDDLDSLSNRVDSLQGAVTKNSEDTQNALNASIAQLQQSISGLQKQQAQAQATISTLQSQVTAAQQSAAATPGAGVTPATPGAAPGAAPTTPTPGTPKNP